MKTKQIIFLLLTLLLYNSCRKPEKDEIAPLTKVEATVTDFNTGLPVADAWVVLYWQYDDGGSPPLPQFRLDSVQTDANGKCNFSFMADTIFYNKVKTVYPGLKNDNDIMYSVGAYKNPYFGTNGNGTIIQKENIANKAELVIVGSSVFNIGFKNLADTVENITFLVKNTSPPGCDVRPYYYNSNADYGRTFNLYQNNDLVLEMSWSPKSNPTSIYKKNLSFQHEYLNTKTYEIIY